MFQWVPYPFVRIVVVFIAGILMGIYTPLQVSINWIILFAIGCCGVYFLSFFLLKGKSVQGIITGVIGLLLIFLFGYLHLHYKSSANNPNHILHTTDSIQTYQAVIISQAQEKAKTWKVEAQLIQYKAVKWNQSDARLILYFDKADFSAPYQYGDVLIIKGSPQEITPPGNPYEFDYKRYLSFQNIFHQHYLRKASVRYLHTDPPSLIINEAYSVRDWASATIKKYIAGEQEQAIVLGLVLGIKDGLDNDLTNAYAAAGGMHVLAVSGLHVGIIYWIILFILKPFSKSNKGRIGVALFSIIVLWAYALVTGLSPSVLRAVTMFSFVALAQPWKQRTNIFNTLAVSAFFLLLYDPYLIMAVGFQLSYAAVLGIVYLQPKLSTLYTSRYTIVNKIWELTTVSIAAQLATFAIGLLYFHQFPIYFLFSNLFIIPSAFVILVSGIVLLAVSFITPLGNFIGILLGWIVKALNASVFFIESLPFSLLEHIYLTTFHCWLLIILIALLLFFFELRNINYFFIAFLCFGLFSFQRNYHLQSNWKKQKFTIYNIRGHAAFDLFERGVAYSFADSVLANDLEAIRFHIRPNRLAGRIDRVLEGQEQSFTRPIKGGLLLKRKRYSVMWITHEEFDAPINTTIDYLIISNNAVSSISKMKIKAKTIIIDSSNSNYRASKLMLEGLELGIPIHNMYTQGAFVVQQNL